MKRFLPIAIALLVGTAIVVSSCASAAKPAEPAVEPAAEATSAASEAWEEPKAPEKVAKQRAVAFKTPVLAKESSFYADGLLDEYVVYKYDESKQRLLEKATYDASRPDPIERVVSEWKEGRLFADSTFDAEGKLKLRREYGYDAAGKLVLEKAVDSKGKTVSASVYAYDAAGRKAEWRAFDGAGLVKAQTFYAYAPALIEMRDAAGAVTGSIKAEEGPDGRVLKRSYLGPDGSLQKYESYLYEKAALPSSVETRRADGSLVSRTAYAYGELGELVSVSTADGSGSVRDSRRLEYAVREDSRVETYYE